MDILEKLDIKDKKSSKRGAFLYKFNEKNTTNGLNRVSTSRSNPNDVYPQE